MLVATPVSVPSMSPFVNRRGHVRRRPRGGVTVECRKGTLGLGPNLAGALVDLSTHGAGVILHTDLATRQEVEVCLRMTHGRPVKVLAEVVYTLPLAKDGYRAGLQFLKPLGYADFARLT
jgi:PilZ domain